MSTSRTWPLRIFTVLFCCAFLFSPTVIAAPPIPYELKMVQPDPSLPKGLAAFWGKWEGSGPDNYHQREVQFLVIIEKVTNEKATLFTWHSVNGWVSRTEAKVVEEAGGYKLSYQSLLFHNTNEITLKGGELVFNARRSAENAWFKINCKQVP